MAAVLEAIRNYWGNLTERERLMLRVLGGILGALIVLLPVYLLSANISELEDDNQRIATALRDIQRSRGRLAAQRAQRAAAEARYTQRAPMLGGFASEHASQFGLSISDVQQEPERELGRFRVRNTRFRVQDTGLRPAIQMLAAIENSRYPISIERIHIDHRTSGDRYNMQVGVWAFDRQGGGGPDGGVPAARPPQGPQGQRAAGPPSP